MRLSEKFDDFTADHKIVSGEGTSHTNHRSGDCARLGHSMVEGFFHVKQRPLRKRKRVFKTFLDPKPSRQVNSTDNSLGIGETCKDLLWYHCTSTPHRSETYGTAERPTRRVKGGASAVFRRSGLDEKCWVESMKCYCFRRSDQDLLSDRRTPYARRFGGRFRWPTLPFGSLIDYHVICAE